MPAPNTKPKGPTDHIIDKLTERFENFSVDFIWDLCFRVTGYVQNLEEHVENLQNSVGDLKALKTSVLWRVEIEEQKRLRKRLPQVLEWFKRVDALEEKSRQLIEVGEREVGRLCLGGYCSCNWILSTSYGRKVVECNQELTALKGSGENLRTGELVEDTPPGHGEHLGDLEDNIEKLEDGIGDLRALKKHVMEKVRVAETELGMKVTPEVRAWFDKVDSAVNNGLRLMKRSEEEVTKIHDLGDGSTAEFSGKVEKCIKRIDYLRVKGEELKKADDAELVMRVVCQSSTEPPPDAELVSTREVCQSSTEPPPPILV